MVLNFAAWRWLSIAAPDEYLGGLNSNSCFAQGAECVSADLGFEELSHNFGRSANTLGVRSNLAHDSLGYPYTGVRSLPVTHSQRVAS